MRRMNYPLLVWGSLAIVASISGPGFAQTSLPNTADPAGPTADPAEQLEPTTPDSISQPVTEPLEVNQQQADQFFRPAPRPQIVERTTSSGSEDETLIEPPPGSQTPAEVTPGQRLNLQIR